jgi:predicted Zn-dependent peptidase
LRRAQAKLEADAVRELLSAGGVAHGLGLYQTTLGTFEPFFDTAETVRRVTAEQVQAAAKQILQNATRVVCLGRPSGEVAEDASDDDGEWEDGQ